MPIPVPAALTTDDELSSALESHVQQFPHPDGLVDVVVGGTTVRAGAVRIVAGTNVSASVAQVDGVATVTIASAVEATPAKEIRSVDFSFEVPDAPEELLSDGIVCGPALLGEPSTIVKAAVALSDAPAEDVTFDVLANGASIFGNRPKLIVRAGTTFAAVEPPASAASPMHPTRLSVQIVDGADEIPAGAMATVQVFTVPVAAGTTPATGWLDRHANSLAFTEEPGSQITDLTTPSDGGPGFQIEVFNTAGGTITTETSPAPFQGGRSLKLAIPAECALGLRRDLPSPVHTLFGAHYVRFGMMPSSIGTPSGANALRHVSFRDGATFLATISVPAANTTNAGRIQIHAGNGATLKALSDTVLEPDKWFRLEWLFSLLDGGFMILRIFASASSETPDEELVATGFDASTQITRVDRGKLRGTSGANGDAALDLFCGTIIDSTRGWPGAVES